MSSNDLTILVVSNHWGSTQIAGHKGIFVDRQISSLRNKNITVYAYDIGTSHSLSRFIKNTIQLRKYAQQINAALIHARYGTITAAVSILTGLPTVITFCGSDLLPGASVSLVRTYAGIFLSNLAAIFAKKIICVSEELRQALWWTRSKAVIISDGVDLDLFIPGDQVEARQYLEWDKDHPIVIIDAARDPQNKGLELACQAMVIVNRTIPNAELKIVKNIDPQQMPLCYQAADVLLCASRQEGSPNVVKEALACNLPVVSTPVGDVPERLMGVSESMIVPRDPQAIGNALIEILLMRARSDGRKSVSELDMSKTAEKVISVYRSVLSKS